MLQVEKPIPVELAVELLKLAQESTIYDSATMQKFYHKNITADRCYLGLLPLDTIIELRRLARTFQDHDLLAKIEQSLA